MAFLETTNDAASYLCSVIASRRRGIPHRLGVITFNIEPPPDSPCYGLTPADVRRYRADTAAGHRSAIPGLVRVRFGAYNTFEEVDRLVEALSGTARGEYMQDRACGEYSVPGWSPDLAAFFCLANS